MRYDGQRNSPGAPGNGLFAGVNLPFGGGGGYKTIQEQYRPGSSDRQRIPDPIRVFPQNEPGREGAIDVKFRQAMFGGFPGAIGNIGGLVAQAQNVGAAAGASALGGGMGMNNEQMQYLMQTNQRQGGGPPIQFGVDIENEKVKNLRGSVNAQLDANQAVRFGGNYNVQDQSGQLGLGYETPMFGFDVNLMRTPAMQNMPAGYGVQGNVMGRF